MGEHVSGHALNRSTNSHLMDAELVLSEALENGEEEKTESINRPPNIGDLHQREEGKHRQTPCMRHNDKYSGRQTKVVLGLNIDILRAYYARDI